MTTINDAYDMLDRFLRNKLGDDDYAEYSEALDALAAPECRPMTLAEIKLNPVISYFGVESGEKIVRAVEAFHGIKEPAP